MSVEGEQSIGVRRTIPAASEQRVPVGAVEPERVETLTRTASVASRTRREPPAPAPHAMPVRQLPDVAPIRQPPDVAKEARAEDRRPSLIAGGTSSVLSAPPVHEAHDLVADGFRAESDRTIAPPDLRRQFIAPATRALPRTERLETARLATESQRLEPTPTIKITIGRVDVRAVTAPSAAPRPSSERRPQLSLDDYLHQRSGGRS
jgi:hypothetical protein